MADYQLTDNPHTVRRTVDCAYIPDDPANRDWQQYQQFLADGGVPDPAPPPSRVGVIVQSTNALRLSQARELNAHGKTKDAVNMILDHLEPNT